MHYGVSKYHFKKTAKIRLHVPLVCLEKNIVKCTSLAYNILMIIVETLYSQKGFLQSCLMKSTDSCSCTDSISLMPVRSFKEAEVSGSSAGLQKAMERVEVHGLYITGLLHRTPSVCLRIFKERAG